MLKGTGARDAKAQEIIKLESILVGRSRCTSVEAIARFFTALTEAQDGPAPQQAETPAKRRRAAERAQEALIEAGC